MPEWTFNLYEGSTRVAELTDATDRRVSWRVSEPGEASFRIAGSSPRALLVQELVTDLVVARDGVPLWRGRVTATKDSVSASEHTVEVSATDYRGVLKRRLTWAHLAYPATSPTVAAISMLTTAQGYTGGDLGITYAAAASKPAKDLTAKWGTPLDKVIDTWAALDPGWDWWIDAERVFRTGTRGTLQEWPLRYGETVSAFDRTFDPETYANLVRQSGADDAAGVSVQVVPDLATRPEGRWEVQVGDSDLETNARVIDRAVHELARRSTLAPSYVHTVVPGTWTPEKAFVGDVVPVQHRSGRIDANFVDRITEVEVTLDDSGLVVPKLTTGSDLRRSLTRFFRQVPERLTLLNRR